MVPQMLEQPIDKLQKQKRLSWILWTLVSIVVTSIIAFTVVAFLILKSQGIVRGTITLTIVSIVLGVAIGLLSLMISFLQWHHPRPSTAFETPLAFPTP